MPDLILTVGDWVCFMQSARLVYGRVEYIRPRSPWHSTPALITSAGEVSGDAILEVRRA